EGLDNRRTATVAVSTVSAGNAADTVARIVLDQVSKQIGQSFVIENRTGAGGTIGSASAAKADQDGYTILLLTADVTQDSLDLLARWPLARTQQRQHGPAGRRLDDRLEAIVAGMCVEQCKLLLSVHCIVGVIDVEHDAARHALKTGTEQIDQFEPHARKLPPARGVL